MAARLERTKTPGIYRRHVKGCEGERCDCPSGYVVIWRQAGEQRKATFPTMAEAREAKRQRELGARLAKGHAAGLHRSGPQEGCPECERERTRRERTFDEFAAEWVAEHEHEWAANTRTDYLWRLNGHLLPWFGERLLSEIDIDCVDAYKAHKLREGAKLAKAQEEWRKGKGEKPDRRPLGPRSINMTLVLLSAILESAEERDLVTRNPARGKRRRVREGKPRRTQLDTATSIASLLDAAGELDREAQVHPQPGPRQLPRRAVLMALLLSGPRIGELIDLRWADIDLANGRIQYDSKTPAGCRWLRLLPSLREELTTLKHQRNPAPRDWVFATATGGRQSESNVRQRVLAKALERANANLAADGSGSLPHLTPHSCRRTYASIRYALGASPADVMAELGHTNPSLALAVYAQAMRMSDQERARLRRLVEGAATSTASGEPPSQPGQEDRVEIAETSG